MFEPWRGRQLDQGVGSMTYCPRSSKWLAAAPASSSMAASAAAPDVVKALTLGADAVVCGRLYVYGLAAAGAPGMVRMFEILEDRDPICLSLLGVTGYHELDKSYIRRRAKSCRRTSTKRLPAPEPGARDLLAGRSATRRCLRNFSTTHDRTQRRGVRLGRYRNDRANIR